MSAEQPVRILVTGVGAVIGQGIVMSLRMRGNYYIVGLDRNPDAYGKHICDAFYAKPDLCESEPAYTAFFLNLFEKENIDLVMPGIEQDIFYFDQTRSAFENSAADVVLNNSNLIRLSSDKWLMHNALLSAGLTSIPSSTEPSWGACLEEVGPAPVLFKPRRGSGGRNQFVLEDEKDFDYLVGKYSDNFMVQKLVGNADEEYTVGLFGYGDGTSSRFAILKRKLGAGGATWSAESLSSDPQIEQFGKSLCEVFKPLGPTNFQFRKSDGKVWLLEINPRFSSSISLRAALGFNEADMCVDFFVRKLRPTAFPWKRGVCQRYIQDHVVFL